MDVGALAPSAIKYLYGNWDSKLESSDEVQGGMCLIYLRLLTENRIHSMTATLNRTICQARTHLSDGKTLLGFFFHALLVT